MSQNCIYLMKVSLIDRKLENFYQSPKLFFRGETVFHDYFLFLNKITFLFLNLLRSVKTIILAITAFNSRSYFFLL